MGRLNLAFEKWCQDQAIGIESVKGDSRLRSWRYRIQDLPDCLQISIKHWNLSVVVLVDGVCLDLIFDRDVSVMRCAEGFACRECQDQGDGTCFATLEALWADHLFAPFTDWYSGTLCPARYLCLFGVADSMTWADLQQEAPEDCIRAIPLHALFELDR